MADLCDDSNRDEYTLNIENSDDDYDSMSNHVDAPDVEMSEVEEG